MSSLQIEFEEWIENESTFFNLMGQDVLDGLWFWDLKNPKNGLLNDAFWQLLGYDTAPLQQDSFDWFSLIDQENLLFIIEAYNNHLANPKQVPFDVEVACRHRIGYSLIINFRGAIAYDELGNPNRLMGIAIHLDKYRKTKKQNALKKDRYIDVIEGVKLGIWGGNINTGEAFCNDIWAEMIGYSLAELEPMTSQVFYNLVHPEDKEELILSIDKLLKNEGTYEVEFRMRHKKGHWVWIFCRGEITAYDNQGKPEMVSGMHYDITEKKANEELVLKYKDLLERSNEAAKIGHWEIDLQNESVLWSKVTREIYEVSEDFIPTIESGLQFIVEGENRDRIVSLMEKAAQSPMEFKEQIQIKSNNGTVKWIRLIGLSEFTNGQCVRFYGLIQDVDVIENIQLKIRLREEEFRQSFNHSAMGMAFISLTNRLLQANTSFCEMFGYTEAEMKNMEFSDISHPKDFEANKEPISELFSGKRSNLRYDYRYIHKNGSVVWTNSSISAIHNQDGEVMHYVLQVLDITERKLNELSLQHNADLISRINDVANIGIWEMDLAAGISNWSPMIKQMAGVPENYSPTLEDVYTFIKKGKHRGTIKKSIKLALEEGIGFNHIIQVTSNTGRTFWSRIIGISDFVDGKCRRFYGFFQDVDKETVALNELAIKEEELRLTFEHAHTGMGILDLNGKLQRSNISMTAILGYSEEEMRNLSFFDITHPEDLKKTEELMSQLLGRERDSYKLEKRYIHKNGHVIWANVSLSAVKNEKGDFLHFVSQLEDITDKKQMTDNLTEHNNRLVNFAHIVSHNLRSHTSNISMLLDLAEEEESIIVENEYFKNIKIVSENMNDTICHLNEIVEINSKVSTTLSSQNLLENVRMAVKSIESLAKQSGSTIEININKDLNVFAVHAYLESILLNYLTNAIKYKSPDRKHHILITAGIEGAYVYLSVKDNGMGIDLERYSAKLFGMYKTFHNHPDARGVGLFICKNQVEAMGGKIVVESEVDKGANFITYFRHENN
ncbi:PAS domain-containing sensor histidine kinase [Arenibacter certesii]|uniref:histidine kinase n=1 Tax=Arenibacter certesii TaxID=228955 RepID=A0A918MIT2_9FLAO|nr:PAS domain S-box protein [Arenibacter certesii]GGW28947.1 hypothetical protein GCM10007383_12940 [Arenibacter certesii]